MTLSNHHVDTLVLPKPLCSDTPLGDVGQDDHIIAWGEILANPQTTTLYSADGALVVAVLRLKMIKK